MIEPDGLRINTRILEEIKADIKAEVENYIDKIRTPGRIEIFNPQKITVDTGNDRCYTSSLSDRLSLDDQLETTIRLDSKINNIKGEKETIKMNNNFCGIINNNCNLDIKMTYTGGLAICRPGTNEYISYSSKTNTYSNATGFIINLGVNPYMIVPTNTIEVGDDIVIDTTPYHITKVNGTDIEGFNYYTKSRELITPQTMPMFESLCFYNKIVTLFDLNNLGLSEDNPMTKTMLLAALANITSAGNGANTNPMLQMMIPLVLSKTGLLDSLFNFDKADRASTDKKQSSKKTTANKTAD